MIPLEEKTQKDEVLPILWDSTKKWCDCGVDSFYSAHFAFRASGSLLGLKP